MNKQLTRGSVLLGAALFFMTGCGGSGSPAAPLNALSGVYSLAQWSAAADAQGATSHWGTVNADGAMSITPQAIFQNQGGVVSGPMLPESIAFDLGADNALRVTTSGSVLIGGLTADGSVAALASMSENADPGMLVLGRTGSGFSNASLSGAYHLAAYWLNNNALDTAWFDGSVTFDGVGNVTGLAISSNAGGDIDFEAGPMFGSYAVDPAGTMQWIPPIDVGPFEGGIYANGEIAVLSASSDEHNHQGIIVLIKKGAALSQATFSGDYKLVALFGSGNGNAHGSLFAPVTADGAGAWSRATGTLNVDGVIQPPMPATADLPYTVTASGRLDMADGQLLGAVSETGRFVVAAGGTKENTEPQLWLLIR